jgi:tripartite-type tricarboxylate transporter receptor subunit TctC
MEEAMLGRLFRFGCAVSGLVALAAGSALSADTYPNKPIRLVVGFAAGGSTDIPARYIADKLGKALGQRVLVENKPGAGGMLATRDVLAQPRDGYNLLLCTHFESINTAAYRNPLFKLSDLAPISLVSKYFYGLALANVVPANDLKSFIAYAKANPGKISYATIGAGSAQEIFARQLESLAGIKMTPVPYRGGSAVVQDLVPGRVQFYVGPMISVIPLADNKQVKALGVSSPERLKSAPQVPTLKEQGIDFVRFGWLGFCAGAGTPKPIIDLLNKHLVEIIASPDYRAVTERSGSVPVSSTPEELHQVLQQTYAEFAPTIRELGIQR